MLSAQHIQYQKESGVCSINEIRLNFYYSLFDGMNVSNQVILITILYSVGTEACLCVMHAIAKRRIPFHTICMLYTHQPTDQPFDLFTHWVWNKVVVVGNCVLVCTSFGWKSLKKRNDKQRACFAFHIIWIEGIQHRLHSCSSLAIQWMENSNKNIECK